MLIVGGLLRMRHISVSCCLALLVLLGLSGCAAKDQPPQEILTPMPVAAAFSDPGNGVLMDSVTAYLAITGAPLNSRYEFTRVDLNGDGRREGLVMMKSPHQHWCNSNGCRMIVFQAHNDGFTLLSEISPVRGPLTVSNQTTNGWRDLLMSVSGRDYVQTKKVALRFDGRTYPAHPAFQPALFARADIYENSQRIFP